MKPKPMPLVMLYVSGMIVMISTAGMPKARLLKSIAALGSVVSCSASASPLVSVAIMRKPTITSAGPSPRPARCRRSAR